ncbi:MAG: AAA family ATPase [Chloroflexi bacterium]|nr:AAA family ATPase [Chloroflexota bacterium]
MLTKLAHFAIVQLMYVDYFKLNEPPYKNIANPRFLWLSDQHKEARAKMLHYITNSDGPIYLISPIGTGKTTLAKDLENELEADERNIVVRIDAPKLSTTNAFLRLVMDEFDVKTHRAYADSLKSFKEWLVAQATKQPPVSPILLIDEAQNMTRDMLLLIQHLFNFSTDDKWLIQMAIFSQPEIQIAIDKLPSLKSRLAVAKLRPFSDAKMTKRMLKVRWRTAGGTSKNFPFTDDKAVSEIQRLTGGVPRYIVRLAHETLAKLMVAERVKVRRLDVIEGYAEMTVEERNTKADKKT